MQRVNYFALPLINCCHYYCYRWNDSFDGASINWFVKGYMVTKLVMVISVTTIGVHGAVGGRGLCSWCS